MTEAQTYVLEPVDWNGVWTLKMSEYIYMNNDNGVI